MRSAILETRLHEQEGEEEPMHGSLSYSLQASDPQSRVTNGLYACARQRGQRGQLWASLSGRSQGLLVLGEVGEACSIEAQSGGGLRTVAISQRL
jgi:hypothetical protein